VVEKLKEGYESDVVEDDSDSPSGEKYNSEARRSKGKLIPNGVSLFNFLSFLKPDGTL
jgi:hypothetical protein